MFKINGNTITITAGDTGSLQITITGKTFASGSKTLLTVATKDKNPVVVLQKIADISGNSVTFNFVNSDTATFMTNNYLCEIRFVVDPVISNGVITGGSEIITPFDTPLNFRVLDALGDIGVAETDD